MYRFYCPILNENSTQTVIEDPHEIHHLRNVLHLRDQDALILFNGKGKEAEGTILKISPKQIVIETPAFKTSAQSLPTIILACAVPKKGKFDTIVEKATELGADVIIPLITQRTEVVWKKERSIEKSERLRKIALNASKQCRRNIFPEIYPPTSLKDFIESFQQHTTILMPSLAGQHQTIFDALSRIQPAEKVAVCIGPEGDFTPKEYEEAFTKGVIPVSLGSSILKVETATFCALSCLRIFFKK